MANAYCLWRRSKSPMQSNPRPRSRPSPLVLSCIPSAEVLPPASRVCALLYKPRCYPFAANVNSFCHALNGAKPVSFSLLPTHLPLLHNFVPSIERYVYLYFAYLYLYLARTRFLASNDIYAILIEYLLYMQPHTQELSLPFPVHSTSSCL